MCECVLYFFFVCIVLCMYVLLFVCMLSPYFLRSSYVVMSTMRSWWAMYSPLNAGHLFNMCALDSNCWFGSHRERLYWVGSACSLALITNFRMPALTAGLCSAECDTAGSAHCRHASCEWRCCRISCMSGCPAFFCNRHDVESLQHAHLSPWLAPRWRLPVLRLCVSNLAVCYCYCTNHSDLGPLSRKHR